MSAANGNRNATARSRFRNSFRRPRADTCICPSSINPIRFRARDQLLDASACELRLLDTSRRRVRPRCRGARPLGRRSESMETKTDWFRDVREPALVDQLQAEHARSSRGRGAGRRRYRSRSSVSATSSIWRARRETLSSSTSSSGSAAAATPRCWTTSARSVDPLLLALLDHQARACSAGSAVSTTVRSRSCRFTRAVWLVMGLSSRLSAWRLGLRSAHPEQAVGLRRSNAPSSLNWLAKARLQQAARPRISCGGFERIEVELMSRKPLTPVEPRGSGTSQPAPRRGRPAPRHPRRCRPRRQPRHS